MFKKIITYTISIVICLLMLGSLIFSKDTYSSKENRYLATFPKISENFFNDLSSYLNDHFIFRDQFIEINSLYQKYLGKQLINNVYLAKDNYQIEKYEKSENNQLIIDSINNFIDNNKNINIEVLISPTSVAINKDKLPKYAINDDQEKDIKQIYEGINCKTIDVYDELLKTEDAFYKLDHHWTVKGAYAAYQKYCKVNNIEAVKDDIKLVADDFKGTIYNKTIIDNGIADLIYAYNYKCKVTVEYNNQKFDSLYDEEYLKSNDKYAYFMSSNHPLVKIVNETIESQDKLLIIKDSYANCFIPYIIENYKEIDVIDPRYYGLSIHDYLLENEINNILFLYNMSTLKDDIGIIGIE